ncbi:MAG: glycosyltransferase family 39 protein [Patescibacteria group bacterium]|nr:glycosyltransferase family 39 protein [Patescibacteria group bacterium]
MTKIISFIRRFWREICVVLLAAVFFAAACGFIAFTQRDGFVKWGSPDETANYIFAKLYAQTGQLTIYEKYNPFVSEIMQPRSFRSDNGLLKPVSFLGVILIYGTIAKLISVKVIPFLTPFFAALAFFFYYLLIKKIFTPRVAFLSSLLLLSFPVFYFYSVHSLFHNVLFVSLLVISLYFIVLAATRAPRKNKFFSWRFWQMDWLNLFLAALGGLFVGGALITRTSEAIWLLPALIVLWLFNLKKIGILKLIIIVCFVALPFVPVLFWNEILYGGYSNGGYVEINRSITTVAAEGVVLTKTVVKGQFSYILEPLNKIKNTVFYFGLNYNQAGQNFKNYFPKMFPLLFWPAFLGLILFMTRVWKWKKKYWAYFFAYFIASAILVLYYGSWVFNDNPNLNEITIGNSYTRYWLPIYLGAMPFAAFFISRLSWAIFARDTENSEVAVKISSNKFKNFFLLQWPSRTFSIGATQAVIIIFIFFFSANFLVSGSKEGLLYVDSNNQVLKSEYDQVLRLTEPSAVIITRYHDKIFFPERKVVVNNLTDPAMLIIYQKLAKYIPVYYFNFTFPEKDFKYLNDGKLKQAGLVLQKIKSTDDIFTLYKLENFSAVATSTVKIIKKPLTILPKRDKNE